MFVTSAHTFTIRQRETQKTTLHQEQHSKIDPKIGYARYAEWEKTSFPKQNKKNKRSSFSEWGAFVFFIEELVVRS